MTLLVDVKMMVFPIRLTVPRTERSASNVHPCGECWLINSQFSSLMGATKVLLSSQLLTPAHKSLSMKDRRNGVGKLVFKLASLGSGQTFTLVAPDLYVPCISPEVLQRILSQASTANV